MTQRNKSYDSKHIFSLLPLIRVIFLQVRREGSNLNFDPWMQMEYMDFNTGVSQTITNKTHNLDV